MHIEQIVVFGAQTLLKFLDDLSDSFPKLSVLVFKLETRGAGEAGLLFFQCGQGHLLTVEIYSTFSEYFSYRI